MYNCKCEKGGPPTNAPGYKKPSKISGSDQQQLVPGWGGHSCELVPGGGGHSCELVPGGEPDPRWDILVVGEHAHLSTTHHGQLSTP